MSESRVLAVLFADLVESTRLLVELGDRGVELSKKLADRLAARTTERGGVVTKELGDGLMATFPSAGAAIDAAIDLQQQTWILAREEEANLELTVGISIGDLSPRGDGDWIGLPAVEAARLCSAATAGQILATDTALALARRTADAVSLGALELKGLDETVPTSAVSWEPTSDETAPAPTALTSAMDGPFVGRRSALEELTDAWKHAATGQGEIVLIAGEPGIGKSRLAAEVATRARDAGATVAYGHCDDSKGLAYEPFVEATRFLLANTDTDAPDGLERLLPELAKQRSPSPVEPELARLELLDAVRATVHACAASSPLVLVLEDLHWANDSTLSALRHVLDGIDQVSMLVIVTYRNTEVDRRHPLGALLADLRRRSGVTRIGLDGLSVGEVEDLLAARAGYDLDEGGRDFALALHAETGGNAFFVREVLAHLVEAGALVEQDGRWVAADDEAISLPEGVRDVVGRRLSALTGETNDVLTAAAIVGRSFDVRVLEAITGVDVTQSVDEALDAGLVRETGRLTTFQFTHALVQETLVAELSSLRRAKQHAAVADALDSLPHDEDQLPEIASHAIDAVPFVDLDRLADWVSAAGEHLFYGGAAHEAVELGGRALRALDDLGFEPTPAIADMVTSLSGAHWWVGDREPSRALARRAITLAQQCGSDDAFVRAVASLARAVSFGVDLHLASLLDDAVARARPGSEEHVQLRGAQIVNGLFLASGEDIVSAGAELAELASRTEAERTRGAARFYEAWGAAVSPDAAHARAVADRAIEDLTRTQMPPLAYIPASWAALRQGDLRAAERYVTDMAEAPGSPMVRAGAHQLRAILASLRLDLADARHQVDLVRRSAPDDDMFDAGCTLQELWLDVLEGSTAAARSSIEGLETPYVRFASALRGFLSARDGDMDAAAADYATAIEGGVDSLGRDWTYTGMLHVLGELAADLDDAGTARVLDAALEPYGEQLVLTMCTHVPASVPFTRGRLALAMGERERGLRLLERALEIEEAIGATALSHRTRTELERVS